MKGSKAHKLACKMKITKSLQGDWHGRITYVGTWKTKRYNWNLSNYAVETFHHLNVRGILCELETMSDLINVSKPSGASGGQGIPPFA